MPPTPAECLAFWNEQRAKPISALAGMGKAIREKWPAYADRMVYYEWSQERADNAYARDTAPTKPEDLKKMIATMNYNNDTDRGKLVTAMEQNVVPWLPVGRHQNGGIYRIVAGAYGLQPDQPNPKTDRMLVSTNVLGVNTNVQPRIPLRSRKANFSEESTKSNESDDSENGGFVFHQIGTLEYWGGEVENFQSLEDAANGPWLNTKFCAVVRFGRNGAANGIYIIYDFYPEDEDGERNWKNTSDGWGILREDRTQQQFSIAKLADTITELRFGRTFNLTEVLDYPVEIVRAVKTPEDAIIRVTIA
ncbi:hypothetical protein GP486_002880 [Trichoglossum hirsutum]|uniref:Uncharacterized protein n=1 Tax=Trichoglossum hirsutum TaxID=265104 RepID=A0A9P8LED6_9PEZI|nr:hypothetical protein GP486_002880 [Trichoglossum hirsutum]